HWYLASLSSPAEHVAGATFVGGPLFLVGHNEKAAWGLTAGLVDNTDLFMEDIGPDGRSVRQGDSYQPCHVMEEVIEVKGSAPVTESVLITPRGPIISPGLHETSQALSLRATWLDPLPVTGLFRIHQVGSFEEFRAAFRHWPVAAQNMVYADTSGTIGWQLIGRAPVRKKGHGTLPQHGADPGAGWRDDPVPFEEMPSLENPPSGFVATANNRPQPEGVGPFLGVDFIDGYRYQAIHDALGQRRDWTVEDTLALQMNQQAMAWVEMRDFVLSARGSDPDTRLALRLLGEWDGHLGGDSIPAAVYELFLSEMFTRITRAKAPNSWRWLLGANLSPITRFNFTLFRRTGHLIRLLRQRPAGWFSHPWEQEIAQALGEAVRRLRAHRGADQHRWKWGEVRPLVMHHLLSRAPGKMGRAFAAIFNLGPFPCGGDADVINQAGIEPLTPFAKADNIASMRAVFDVGAWENCRFTLPGGQSGNPLSPHYGDLFPLWQKGQGVPIAFTAEEVEQARQKTLILRPSS
ncbi:MAG: penicillin acylase family protein, partial [Gemmataceae bacterium]